MSRITAISTYYPSCLSAERPCGHALAPGKLNGPQWTERQTGQSWGKGERKGERGGRHKGSGPWDSVGLSPGPGPDSVMGQSKLE